MQKRPLGPYCSWSLVPRTTILWNNSGLRCLSQILFQPEEEILPSSLLSPSEDWFLFWFKLKRKWMWHHFLIYITKRRDKSSSQSNFSVCSHHPERLQDAHARLFMLHFRSFSRDLLSGSTEPKHCRGMKAVMGLLLMLVRVSLGELWKKQPVWSDVNRQREV